jgi:hypothetical protein
VMCFGASAAFALRSLRGPHRTLTVKDRRIFHVDALLVHLVPM